MCFLLEAGTAPILALSAFPCLTYLPLLYCSLHPYGLPGYEIRHYYAAMVQDDHNM